MMDVYGNESYLEAILGKLPRGLQLYNARYKNRACFSPIDPKDRDDLHEFLYLLMRYIYTAPSSQAKRFWQDLNTHARQLSVVNLASLRKDVLANVALAKTFDRLGITFWWAYTEDPSAEYMTFRLMDGLFAQAFSSDHTLRTIPTLPHMRIHDKQASEAKATGGRLRRGYYILVPEHCYGNITGVPKSDLIAEVVNLTLPTTKGST